ncbi:MAG: carbon-nitrogen hydrolase family protein [Myxococcales bacterium]
MVQVCSNDNLNANLENAEKGVLEAAARGASFIALPENFAYMRREGTAFPCAQQPDGEILKALSEWSLRHRVWLLGGTFPEAIEGDSRVYNTSVLFSPDGELVARYRKIHLFDASLGPDGSDSYRESTHFKPGDEIASAETPFGVVGLSVCYDLRFPELYRALVEREARWLMVPSAFARETGKDHWEVLLRARAIESQCFVVAPAQCGHHSADRSSYGRSLIIDPWGLVVAQAADEPCVLVADCRTQDIDRVRGAIPALSHRRLPSATAI